MNTEQIIAQTKNLIITTDYKGNLKSANPAFYKTLGYTKEEVLNKKFEEFVHPEDIENTNEQFSKIVHGQECFGFENRYTHKNGELVYIIWNSFPLEGSENLICGIGNVVTDLKRAELSTLRTKQLLETSQSIAYVGGWELDLITKENFWTEETYRIHDTSREEFNPTVDAGIDFYSPESQEILKKALQAAIEKGEDYDLELELRTVKGRLIHVRTNCTVIFHEGKPVRLVGAFQDITDRKTYEEKIEESESSINSIINSLPFGVCVIDQEGNILRVNEVWEEFGSSNGIEVESFDTYNYFDVCRADHRDENAKAVLAGLLDLLDGRIASFSHEYPCHAPNKKQWFLLKANLMKSGQKQIVISHIDITKRKLLEIEQQKLIEQANLAMKAGELGLWTLDITSGHLEWNDQQLEIYGLSRDEFEEGIDDWQKQLHPEDAEFANEKLSGVFKGEAFHNVEFRIIRRSGEIRHVQASGTPIYNQDNKPSQFIGINRDVTEFKHAEQELRDSDRVFNLSIDMFCIAGFDGYFKHLNPAWERTLGWSTEELLTKPWIEFVHPDDKNNTEDIKTVIVDGQEVLEFENRYVCKDGSVKWLSWKSQPFPEEDIMVGTARDITTEKEQEQKLKQNELHLQRAQQIAQVGSWHLNLKTNKINWTEELYKMFGLDPAMPIPPLDEQQHHHTEKSWELLSSAIDKISKDGVPYELELNIIRKDTSMGWILARGEALKNDRGEIYALSGVAQDITIKKLQEQSLKQSERHLKNAQRVAKVGSWYLDIKSNVVTWTEELFKMFGLDPEMPVPKWNEQQKDYTEESWERLSSAVEKASKDGAPYELELNIIRKDKSMGWITSRGEALKDDDGNIYALSGVAQDITSKKENLLQLEKAKMKAEEADKSKSVFLANMSHEIRTPLNAIIGFSRLLTDDLTASDKKMYLDQVHSNSKHLLTLVDDILNISKIESEQIKIINKPVRLHQLVQEIFDYHVNHIKNHDKENVVLELNLPKNAIENDFIELDPVRLKEILHNLICNAIKFTVKGTIQIGYSYKPKELEFFVRDEGIGIAETHLQRIFERFAQAPDISENYGGTGLGLAICKGLIKKMGGQIWVESKINVGSTFFFTLPKISTDSSMKKSEKQVSNNFSVKNGEKVLIADDSPSVQLYYKSIMKKHQVDAIIVKSGQEALDCYNQNMNSIGLVLMDIRMPGMDGIETMKRLKKINSEIKVIAQTAFAMKTELERFKKLGFNGCLTKPIAEEELIKLVKAK